MLRGMWKALFERLQASQDARVYNRAGLRLVETAEGMLRNGRVSSLCPPSEREARAIERHLARTSAEAGHKDDGRSGSSP